MESFKAGDFVEIYSDDPKFDGLAGQVIKTHNRRSRFDNTYFVETPKGYFYFLKNELAPSPKWWQR